jgi:hypothetical protein
MQIQVYADHGADGREKVVDYVRGVVEGAVRDFTSHITGVEVHLSDENGAKSSHDDKRCMMEARVEERNPIVVTHHGTTMDEAIGGAAGKLRRSLADDLERLQEQR